MGASPRNRDKTSPTPQGSNHSSHSYRGLSPTAIHVWPRRGGESGTVACLNCRRRREESLIFFSPESQSLLASTPTWNRVFENISRWSGWSGWGGGRLVEGRAGSGVNMRQGIIERSLEDEAPMSKDQAPKKHQISNSKSVPPPFPAFSRLLPPFEKGRSTKTHPTGELNHAKS